MLPALVLLIFLFMLYKTTVRPIVGLAFMWFAIWLYPNTLMYGLLPLNIRLDDLFVFSTFIICLWKKPPHIKIWSTGAFRLAMIWWFVHLLGNLNGVLYSGSSGPEVVKFLGKAVYIPMTVAIITCTVHNYEDVKFFSRWLMIAGASAAVLGIGTVLYPGLFNIFLVPNLELSADEVVENIEGALELSRRARGSLGTVGTSLVCLYLSTFSLYVLTTKKKEFLSTAFVVCAFGLSLLGLAYTQSRGPLLAFAASGLFILLGSKNKGLIIPILVFGCLILLTDNPVSNLLLARFTGTTGSTIEGGLSTRSDVWSMFADKFDPILMFNGMGMVASKNVYNATAHNTYLGALVYGGLWGVILLIVLVVRGITVSNKLLRYDDDFLPALFGGFMRVAVLFMVIVGMSVEVFQTTTGMQIFFAFMIMCDKLLIAEKEARSNIMPDINMPIVLN